VGTQRAAGDTTAFAVTPARLPSLAKALFVLGTWCLFASTGAWADNTCKPAAPLAQAKCTKDAQCCAGLVCQSGTCRPGCHVGGTFYAPNDPDPQNHCQSCQPSKSTAALSSVTNGTACSDGNACTRTDTCQAGICTGGNPVVCTASDQCHAAGTCTPATGVCSNPAKADGTACNDGNACTQTDACQAGVCTGQNPVVCTASDQCHVVGTCDPSTGVCSNPTALDGTACDDGNQCTTSPFCSGGVCGNGVPNCNTSLDLCNLGTCDPSTLTCLPYEVACPPVSDTSCFTRSCNIATGICETSVNGGRGCGDECSTNADCADNNACTQDTCVQSGTVFVCAYAPANCDDGDICTDDFCTDPVAGCQHAPKNPMKFCDDGNPCTIDTCVSKEGCVHTYAPDDPRLLALCAAGADPCNISIGCSPDGCAYANACDDNNPCTFDFCNVEDGKPVCTHSAPNCSG
jgi:hypothetical protein